MVKTAVRAIEYRWSTQDHMPLDQVPYIGRLRRGSQRLYVATGFKKWANRVEPLASATQFVKENVNVARRFVAGSSLSATRRSAQCVAHVIDGLKLRIARSTSMQRSGFAVLNSGVATTAASQGPGVPEPSRGDIVKVEDPTIW